MENKLEKTRKPRVLIEIINDECVHKGYLLFNYSSKYGYCLTCEDCDKVAYIFDPVVMDWKDLPYNE